MSFILNDILNVAQLGIEAEKFKSSQLGRYLFGKAENEIVDAMRLLSEVDPTDVKEIRSLQNKVWVANQFMIWIDEAIESGNFAIDEIRGE